jgi:hypothetical protein
MSAWVVPTDEERTRCTLRKCWRAEVDIDPQERCNKVGANTLCGS